MVKSNVINVIYIQDTVNSEKKGIDKIIIPVSNF